ncbi:ATP-binding protein [Halobaculum sp. MBLA0147]|uniref:ATP-binding protein n=1 Tax=Halobaculum sp. MBLA0147 TaxID=3079934 RepID=UPI00352531F4
MTTLGRREGGTGASAATLALGRHRARDGSGAGAVALDTDGPHAAVVVGKRGSGKSHTLGVLAEGLAAAPGVTPVVLDTMGEFAGLASAPRVGDGDASSADGDASGADGDAITVVRRPRVRAVDLPARAWPSLVGLNPTTPAGGLVWHAVATTDSLAAARQTLASADDSSVDDSAVGDSPVDDLAVDPGTRRVATNHLRRAAAWDVFDPEGLRPRALLTDGTPTVLDCAALPDPATDAVCRVVARGCYEHCLADETAVLPWLLIDEAHVRFDGVAGPALDRLFTRGRSPGVSVVCATQRPAALPGTAVSQSDLLVAHRLTSRADVTALTETRPSYLDGSLHERLPDRRGVALVVDDTTEVAHTVRVRERRTPHDGGSPRASDRVADRPDTDDGSDSIDGSDTHRDSLPRDSLRSAPRPKPSRRSETHE